MRPFIANISNCLRIEIQWLILNYDDPNELLGNNDEIYFYYHFLQEPQTKNLITKQSCAFELISILKSNVVHLTSDKRSFFINFYLSVTVCGLFIDIFNRCAIEI